jgi:competence protein ComEC
MRGLFVYGGGVKTALLQAGDRGWCRRLRGVCTGAVRALSLGDMVAQLPAVPVAAAVLVGVVAGVLLLPPRLPVVVACGFMAAGGLGCWWWLFCLRRAQAAAGVLLLAIATAAAGWGLAWHGLFAATDLAWKLREQPAPVAVVGRVIEAPRPLPATLRDPITGQPIRPASEMILQVTHLREDDAWRPATGVAAVMIDGLTPESEQGHFGIDAGSIHEDSIDAGCTVRLFGRGLRPAAAMNPGEYDFRDEARGRRWLSVIRCASRDCLTVLRPPPWWHPGPLVDQLRTRGAAVLAASMPADMVPLADALLLGNRDWLPREQTQPFLVTGTIHILAISGLHVGILAWALFGLVRATPIGRGLALLLVAGVSGGYMLLVHAEVPVVRATLLVWLACLAAWLGRRPVGINTLAVVAVLMVLRQPTTVFRTGTQLSFLSTAVLILLATALARERRTTDPIARLIEQSRPRWERWLRRVGRGVLVSVGAGAAVWAVAAPLVAMQFHVISPIAVLLNPLIAPLVAVAMGCGLGALVVGIVSPSLAAIPASGCASVLRVIETMASTAAEIPWGFAWVSGPPRLWVAGWYLAVLLSVVLAGRVGVRRVGRWVLPCVIWLMVGAAAWGVMLVRPVYTPRLEVTMASLRHGLGLVVRPPSGEVLVYDAGRLGAPAAARRAMEAVLRDAGITTIDMLVISHADADHFNAVRGLMERFRVKRLVVTSAFVASESPEAIAVVEAASKRAVPVVVAAAGDRLPFSETATVKVLHPAVDAESDGNDNLVSLVLEVEAAGRRLLLTGDLDGDAVDDVLARGVQRVDALIAPHHGSRTSLPPRLAEAVQPRVVLVSGSGDAGWDDVRRAYEQTGPAGHAKVVRTGSGGAIRLRMNAEELRLARSTAAGWEADDVISVVPEKASRQEPPKASGPSSGMILDRNAAS